MREGCKCATLEPERVRAEVLASLGEWLQYGFSTDPAVTDARVAQFERMAEWARKAKLSCDSPLL